MQTTIYLIRHGVTGWNKKKKYCGYIDVPLSKEGTEQARKLARRIKSVKIDAVYSSNLKRAMRTAQIVFGKTRKIHVIPDLQEINFGVLEGLNHDEILKKYGVIYTKWLHDPYKNHIPKGENINSFQKRVTNAINKIAAANRGKTVAAVCHGGTISVFVTGILKKKDFWKYVPHSTSVTVVEYKNRKPGIKLFNCTHHLA